MFVQTAFYSELKRTRSCWWANIINVYYLTTLLINISEIRVKYFFNSSALMAHAYVRHESCQQLPGETVRNTLQIFLIFALYPKLLRHALTSTCYSHVLLLFIFYIINIEHVLDLSCFVSNHLFFICGL